MKLVIGLGNPDKKFNNTRHNIGFDAIDYFCDKHNITLKEKGKSLFSKEKKFIIIKPQTFMNLSGEAVLEITQFYKIQIEDILVIYDDVSIPVGSIRTKIKGSAGGQNGMKNIIKMLGTDIIKRTRVGVDNNSKYDLADWVLSKFTKEETKINKEVLQNVSGIIEMFIEGNIVDAMNRYN